MRNVSKLCSIVLFLNLILVACGPSQEELDATETKVAVDAFATQTANAPTSTATFTASPEPTSTYTPEPTLTPTLAPPPSEDTDTSGDFLEYSVGGFHITLPAHWEVIDIDQEGVDALWEMMEELDTEWAETARAMYSSEEMLEAFDLWAIDSEPEGLGYAMAMVLNQELPMPIEAESLCLIMPATYEQMGIEMVESDCTLEINGIGAARFILRAEVEGEVVNQIQYCYLSGTDMWVLSMVAAETEWSEYEPILFGIAESFRID